jgi:hypothetical protein
VDADGAGRVERVHRAAVVTPVAIAISPCALALALARASPLCTVEGFVQYSLSWEAKRAVCCTFWRSCQ